MRILHILPHLSKGGAERQFSYLAPELVRLNHSLDVAYLSSSPVIPSLSGVTTHRLAAKNNYDPYILWQLIRLIHYVKPDIIQTWILQMDILGGIAAMLTRVPWIFREPSSGLAYCPSWKHRLRVWVGSCSNAIVSNSRGGDEYWMTRAPHSRRYIIPNGLPLDEINRVVAVLPLELAMLEAPIVLYVGRMFVSKNLINLLEALAYVRQRQEVVGIFCGEGSQQTELEVLKHKLGLGAVIRFTGYLPADIIWTLMKQAAVIVSIGEFEGCPNSVLEAMACGCPLVVSDIPAHREILDESCTSFVQPSNIQQIAHTIAQVLTDVNESKARALIARQKSKEWSIGKMARNYESVYKEVVSSSSRVPGTYRKPTIGKKDQS